MSFSNIVGSVKGVLKRVASDKLYNKNEIYQKARSLDELVSYREQFPDEGFIERVIASMPESDFCKIVEVDDCMVGRYHTCTCTKVMVFGNDDVKGKVYEKFTTTTTSSRCRDGNLDLAGKCMTTQEVGSCGEELIKAQQKIEVLAGKLKAIYDVIEIPIDF
jgi:hypothetical protein